ncbi:MAG: amidohydrolase [Acidobacteria bacterium]|nr:amidohydrolase [Acidobacteriota bacterium]
MAAALAALTACASEPAVEPATMVVKNGTIVTMEAAAPEVQALAVRGDRIVAAGATADIDKYVGAATEVIDLGGLTAIPGLIEGHGHFMGLGQSRMVIDLMDVTSWDEIVRLVGEAAAKAQPGEWIRGRGWHQEKWTAVPQPNVEGFPIHDALSKVSPANPVILEHASGHATYVNAKAMELAGITAATKSPAGGDILKDRAGRPIGVLRETASDLAEDALAASIAKRTPEERAADARKVIDAAVQAALEKGVTSFQDAGESFATVDVIKQAAEQGALGIRLWVMVRDTNENIAAKMASYKAVGLANNHLTIAAIKKTIDGAIGSRGAWLLVPYSDMPTSTGLNTAPVEDVRALAGLAAANGVQLGVHAIGDRANREVLDIFEATFKANPTVKDWRWRIEHAQHLAVPDIPRFGQLGIIASMQGIHATSDAPYVRARLGEERVAEGGYVWQKLMKSGAIISNGTDVPVERIDPMPNLHATITRRLKDGTEFFPDQRMTRQEALKSYTWNAAYAAKEETLKGSLAVGKLADITVLSKNIMTVPEAEIPATDVVYTIVGGKVAYRGAAAKK